jgi:hypothetical protein
VYLKMVAGVSHIEGGKPGSFSHRTDKSVCATKSTAFELQALLSVPPGNTNSLVAHTLPSVPPGKTNSFVAQTLLSVPPAAPMQSSSLNHG